MDFDFKRQRRAATGSLLTLFIVLVCMAGCDSNESDTQQYRSYLSINHLKSSYYTEPGTHHTYPLVQGNLVNLGSRKLLVVEFTLRFKDKLRRVIYEEHAYPVYVSDFARPGANQYLEPGAKTAFAFKAPKCPADWQPGDVDIEITKVVFASSSLFGL